MSILIFLAGMLTSFLLIDICKKVIILKTFEAAEQKILLMSMMSIEFKYHVIQLVEIIYDKAIEENQKYASEKEEIINKIHEKYLQFGNLWITQFINLLPYETKYKNWSEAIQYIEKLIKDNKKNI
jgi:hypothetical protein